MLWNPVAKSSNTEAGRKSEEEMTDVWETNQQVATSSSNYRPVKEKAELSFANIHPVRVSLWLVMSSKYKQTRFNQSSNPICKGQVPYE